MERQEMDASVAEEQEQGDVKVQQQREDAHTPGTEAFETQERINEEQAQ